MSKATPWLWVLLAAALLLLYGLSQLMRLRFETGDFFPAYSTHRSDPLGCRGFYESLEKIPGLKVSRFEQPIDRLPDGRGTTLLVLGVGRGELDVDAQALAGFVARGGRLVVAFDPEGPRRTVSKKSGSGKTVDLEKAPAGPKTPAPPPARKTPAGNDDAFQPAHRSFVDTFRFGFTVAARMPAGGRVSRSTGAPVGLPESLPWHTALSFIAPPPAWKTLYRGDFGSALVTRAYGQGTVVLSADPFLLSNEALLNRRQPALLSWLVGKGPRIVFDETHLGIRQQPGVATLARQYHLTGLFWGLALVAAVWTWKNAVPLLPETEPDSEDDAAVVIDHTSTDALVGLMKRHIPARDLMDICVETVARTGGAETERIRRILSADAPNARDPVVRYRAVCRSLSKGRSS